MQKCGNKPKVESIRYSRYTVHINIKADKRYYGKMKQRTAKDKKAATSRAKSGRFLKYVED